MKYNNYHKHTTKSSGFTPDTHIQAEAYFKRAKELGHDRYYTTEHGFGGSIFEAVDLQEKYGIKAVYAMEIYIVPDNQEKDRANYHMMIIAKNNKARRVMNLKNSDANEFGYYGKPRWSLDYVLSLNPNDFFVTTACIGGISKDDRSIAELALPIKKHFGDNFFWELQCSNHPKQIEHNKLNLNLRGKHGGKIIHANDSHYIYPEQASDRSSYLKGKGITYGDEDSFILDYPDYDEIVKRYKEQNVLTDAEIEEALENTLLIDSDEKIDIHKNIKMPTIDHDLTLDERFEKLNTIVHGKLEIEKQSKPDNMHSEYDSAIEFEMNIIKETNDVVHTADYFLLNQKMTELATKKYGGVLTKTGRGSCGGFLVNKILGMTSLDRIELDVPMYPTRFISKSRLLETHSLPDFDYNVKDPEPFVKATKELLGEKQCYWMIAWGTQQHSGAFKNICRDINSEHEKIHGKGNKKISFDDMNKVSKDLDSYRDDPKWKDIIIKSEQQIGAVDSMSRSPGSVLIMNENIREEIGVIRVGEDLCAVITSMEVEDWKYLKNDYLTVTVVKILDDVYNLIGIEQPPVSDFIPLLDDDVWKIYEDGMTRTLNQVSTDNGKRQVMILKPNKYQELSAFVAAIRPGFKSLVDGFLNRIPYSNGVKELDDMLSSSSNFLLYQESIMQFLVWLGVDEDITYGIIKKISKKKFKEGELEKLKENLSISWNEKLGTFEGFEEAWQVVEDNALYSFNSAHSVAVAFDSLYGAWLKAKYPYEYFTTVLNEYENSLKMTTAIVDELKHFGIDLKPPVFGFSKGCYSFDKKTSAIYKGIGSVKNLNSDCAEELFDLGVNDYETFTDLVYDIKNKTSLNTTKIFTLIELDFFKQFGKARKLETIAKMFYKWHDKKTAKFYNKKKEEAQELPFKEELIEKYSEKKTECQYSGVDFISIIKECELILEDEDFTIKEKIEFQKEHLGYINLIDESYDKRYVVVTSLDTKYSPKFSAYCINNGKMAELKVRRKPKRRQPNNTYFEDLPFKEGDILYCHNFERKMGVKKADNNWVETGQYNFWVTKYKVVEENT